MKTFLIIVLCFIATALIADSSKHQFTFTIIVNEMTLEEAGEFEDELQELLEGYGEKASLEIQMGIIPKESENLWYWQYPLKGQGYILTPNGNNLLLDSIIEPSLKLLNNKNFLDYGNPDLRIPEDIFKDNQ